MENLTAKKEEVIHVRVTNLEKKIIALNAKNSGLSVADYIRKCATNKTINNRLTQDELEVYKTLVEFHNNFKRIANRFQYEDLSVKDYCVETANQILKHLNRLQ